MMRSTLFTFTKHTIGRVRRRTSTKQRSMMLVVRSFLQRCRGKLKNDSRSGKSRSSCRTIGPYTDCQRRRKARKAAGLAPAVGAINRLRVGLYRVIVAAAHLFQDVAQLVHPAALMLRPGIDR